MKLRWSNGYSYSAEFSCNSVDTLLEQGIHALRVLRAATQHRIHDGGSHTNYVFCSSGELGLFGEHTEAWIHTRVIVPCLSSTKTSDCVDKQAQG